MSLIFIPLWVFNLLCDEVQGVPARVRVQCGVQSQSHVSWIQFRVFKGIPKVTSFSCGRVYFKYICKYSKIPKTNSNDSQKYTCVLLPVMAKLNFQKPLPSLQPH